MNKLNEVIFMGSKQTEIVQIFIIIIFFKSLKINHLYFIT